MKNKNYYLLLAGILNSFTALLHTIGGQIDLVTPLQNSDLSKQIKAEWFGVWHMVTIVLFATSFMIIKAFLKGSKNETLRNIAYLYIFISIPFMISSVIFQLLAPQWILLLPIGILTYLGHKKIAVT